MEAGGVCASFKKDSIAVVRLYVSFNRLHNYVMLVLFIICWNYMFRPKTIITRSLRSKHVVLKK